MSDDINGFNKLNSESIVTVTDRFGHDQWLHFWQIRQLRRKQLKQTFAYDPSNLYLKSLEDPYDHIAYMKSQTNQDFHEPADKNKAAIDRNNNNEANTQDADLLHENIARGGATPQQVTENVHVMSLSADEIGESGDEEQQRASKPLSPIMEIELSPLSKVSDEMTGLGSE